MSAMKLVVEMLEDNAELQNVNCDEVTVLHVGIFAVC